MEMSMQIQPVQPVNVELRCGHVKSFCRLIQLTEDEMLVSSSEFLDKDSPILFSARYFRGEATIKEIIYSQYLFTYTLVIHRINYQPGLLVNTSL